MNILNGNDFGVGIDLGTTNSVLAVAEQRVNGVVSNVVEIARDDVNSMDESTEERKPLLPSSVFYNVREDGSIRESDIVVGDYAKRQYSMRPNLVAKSIKSQMGSPTVTGLDPRVPDKTPEKISARILRHMLEDASKTQGIRINDAVITVPANFDFNRRQATLKAAEMAGLKVKYADGTIRPIIISEPEAAVYDLINRIENGELSKQCLNIDEGKNILIFDIGGGTLDITLNRVCRSQKDSDKLQFNEIATNRFTKLGGDDFDQALAEELYRRYCKKVAVNDLISRKIATNKENVMAALRQKAESAKLELGRRVQKAREAKARGAWDFAPEPYKVDCSMIATGYKYSDQFYADEMERVLEPLMGNGLAFNDYKKLNAITDTQTIIYPILDVLHKAAVKLQAEPQVDAVVVTGGMSKFYLVTDRLKKFFQCSLITNLDPDKAVARGAAIYHYILMQRELSGQGSSATSQDVAAAINKPVKPVEEAVPFFNSFTIGKVINNEDLYLGTSGGNDELIIPIGAELPYQSEVIRGFKVLPGVREIPIPIKRKEPNGSSTTVANGKLVLKKGYASVVYMSVSVRMDISKLVAIDVEISRDEAGFEVLSKQTADIVIGSFENISKNKVLAPAGTSLNVANELHSLQQLCRELDSAANGKKKKRGKDPKGAITQKIEARVEAICKAGNKAEFAEPILELLEGNSSNRLKYNLLDIACSHCDFWSDKQQNALKKLCQGLLSKCSYGFVNEFDRSLSAKATSIIERLEAA